MSFNLECIRPENAKHWEGLLLEAQKEQRNRLALKQEIQKVRFSLRHIPPLPL